MTLRTTLEAHRAALGDQFQNIGKKSGLFLSYDSQSGWSIVKLGAFEQFVRNFLAICGCYSSTHLKAIALQLQKEAEVPPQLMEKVEASWTKAHPQQPFPEARLEPLPLERGAHPDRVPAHGADDLPLDGAAPAQRMAVVVNGTVCSIEAGDITHQNVDAIVNAVNPQLVRGGGVDDAIHAAAGPRLQERLTAIRADHNNEMMPVGAAVATDAFDLPEPIRYIAHTPGPVYANYTPARAAELLTTCVVHSLRALSNLEAVGVQERGGVPKRVAFPAISTGVYGYPFDHAIQVMYRAIQRYAFDHPGVFDEVKIVVKPAVYAQAVNAAEEVVRPDAVREMIQDEVL